MSKSSHIVFDIETQFGPQEIQGGWNATDKMGVSCAVVYDFDIDRFEVYSPLDVEALKERIESAERVTGFNIWKFDYPVIYGLPGNRRVEKLRFTTDDILRRIWSALELNPDGFGANHRGWSLGDVCGATIGASKNGSGAHAPELFKTGQFNALIDYCKNDVLLTRNLCQHIADHGWVSNSQGLRVEIPPWS